ncbi:MAG: IPTL-CTERM sorting domain-containing protein, partial [Acidobacteriota bacterium]
GPQVDPGQTITYSITVNNTGDGAATGVVVTDDAPMGTSLVDGSVMIATNTGGGTPMVTIGNGAGDTSVQVDIDSISAGGQVVITFDVTVNSPPGVSQIVNVALIDLAGTTPLTVTSTVSINPLAIPTLGEWGLIIIVILLAGAGIVMMRRR